MHTNFLVVHIPGREHSDITRLLDDPSSSLHKFRHNIILVEDPIVNSISSTKVRQELAQVTTHAFSRLEGSWILVPCHNHCVCEAYIVDSAPLTHSRQEGLQLNLKSFACLQGRSVRYLVPDGVIDYIHACQLYSCKLQPTE